MKHTAVKTISLLLAAAMLAALPGCELPGGTQAAEPTATPLVVVGESTGEALQDTYKADHIFSLNSLEGASFNPYSTTSAWNQIVGMLAYDTLVKAGGDFEAQPNLVTGWESQDGRNWTFTVDTSRKFHDGGDMTAYDAVYSINAGINSYGGRYKARFAHVTNMGTLDTASFVVELDQTNWRFYELLNIPCIEAGSLYDSIPPGTGPYKFNSRGTALTLFQDHPDADEMPLRTIFLKRYTRPEDILQAFEDSLLDLVTNNPSDPSSLGYSRSNLIKYVETTNLQFVGFNLYSPLFSYAPYRQMVTYAVDRDTIVSNAMQGSGVAATLPIHPNSALYPRSIAATLGYSLDDLQTVVHNLGGADLDQDGVIDFGSVRGEVTFLVCADSGAKVSAARQIASQLRSVGFAVNLSELTYSDYIKALQEGRYDLYYGEIKLCNDWDLSQLLLPGGAANYVNYQDAALTACIQNFLASDEENLSVNAEALYSYIAQSMPIVSVCFERNQVLYHRGVLTTIDPEQDNLFNDMHRWSVDLS